MLNLLLKLVELPSINGSSLSNPLLPKAINQSTYEHNTTDLSNQSLVLRRMQAPKHSSVDGYSLLRNESWMPLVSSTITTSICWTGVFQIKLRSDWIERCMCGMPIMGL